MNPITVFAAAALTAGFVSAAATLEAPVLNCPQAARAPVIDGRADDPCWRNTPVATDFSVLASGGRERALRQTSVRAVHDARALYLLVVCLEPQPETISTAHTDRDGQTWLDDAVEIFVRPGPPGTAVLHFVINAKGVLYDARGDDASFDVSTTPAVTVGTEWWTVELALPWRDLGTAPPAPETAWAFNVGREHRPHSPTEWSTWAPLEEGRKKFMIPNRFGRLRFVKSAQTQRASSLRLPHGLLRNAWFAERDGKGRPIHWRLRAGVTCSEIAPASAQFAVGGAVGYSLATQTIDRPVHAGEVFTVFAVLRGTPDAAAGVAVVQEMQDGRPDDLYPFWNISLPPYWRLYSGRIVVDKGAKRLDHVSLYRSNRKGRVDCALLQVLPGVHGLPGIVDLHRHTRPDDRIIERTPWRTPGLTPFNPLPGGRLKTLIFISHYQRDVAEFAQRLDMDADMVFCPFSRGSGKVEIAVARDADRVLTNLIGRRYRLIVLAGRPSEPTVIQGIIESVKHGTGLLYIEPVRAKHPVNPEVFRQILDILPSKSASPAERAAVCGGLSLDAVEAQANGGPLLKRLAVGKLGRGSIVRLTWADTVPGLIPFRKGVGRYWELRWGLLARAALWCARRTPDPAIVQAEANADRVRAVVRGVLTPDLRLDLAWDTPDGEFPGGERRVSMPADAGAIHANSARIAFPTPAFLARQRGPVVARLHLRKGAQPLDLAAALLPARPPRVTLGPIDAPETADPGATIEVRLPCRIADSATPAVQAELIDAFGRIVDRDRPQTPPAGESHIRFSLTVRDPLSVVHRIVVTAVDGPPAVAAKTEKRLFVPEVAAAHLDDFHLAAGYAVMHILCQPYLLDAFADYLRKHGVTACTVNEELIERGMPAWGGTVAGMGMRNHSGTHERKPCFSNPANLERLVNGTPDRVDARWKWGYFGYNMDDEVHLSQSATTELCGCRYCLDGFREWARKTYGDISAANREWGTHFRAFDEATMPLIAEMHRKGIENPARWVDYRLYMDRAWANAYIAAAKAVYARHPTARLSFTNPYKFNSLSAVDFSLWVPYERVLLRYFHRHVMDRCRSWSRAPMLAWIGYRQTAAELHRFPWWFVLNGGAVPIWWDPILPWTYSGNRGYVPWNMFDPLWRETKRGRALSESAIELAAGVGRLLRAATAAPPEALIVHSQASLHTLFARAALEKGRVINAGYDRWHASDDALAAALGRAGLNYAYVVSGRLTAKNLDGVKLLALPACVALSDSDIPVIAAFVRRGGRILADLPPAAYSAHGRPLPAPRLAPALFDGTRGVCLGHAAGKDDAVALDAALDRLGVHAAWRVRSPQGGSPGPVQVIRRRLGNVDIIGIVQSTGDAVVRDLEIQLPRAGWVCNLRADDEHRVLGQRKRVRFALDRGETAVFAVLPVRPRGLRVAGRMQGRSIAVDCRIDRDAAAQHVFHVEWLRPGGRPPRPCDVRNVLAPAGRTVVRLPLALNDPPGGWTVRVRDAWTGASARAAVTVPGPPNR